MGGSLICFKHYKPLMSSFVYIKCLSNLGLHVLVNRIIECMITSLL